MRIAALVICIVAFAATRVLAQNSDEQIEGFTRTVFPARDGALGHIYSMAQTPDGWIWLAGKNHLYRFDGITPEVVDVSFMEGGTVREVFAAKSGDVWLTDLSGRTVVLPAGDSRHARTVRNAGAEWLDFFAQDRQGDMWSFSGNAAFKTVGDDWRRIGKESGLVANHFYAALMDTDGTLWVLSDNGVFTLAAEHAQFEKHAFHAAWITAHPNDDENHALRQYGNVYLSIIVALAGKNEVPTYSQSRYRAFRDTRGGFWVMSPAFGIRRAASPNPEALLALGASVGKEASLDPAIWVKMSSSEGGDAFEDLQHNVWVETRTGLELFRPRAATRLKLPSGDYAYAMLPDHDGSIWFGTAQSVHAYRWWHVGATITPAKGYDNDTSAAYRDVDDSVLLGTGGGNLLRHFRDGNFEPVNPLAPGANHGDDILAIARDGQRRLWVSILRHPIAQLDHGKWIVKGGFHQLPDTWTKRMVTDAQGRLWICFPHAVFVIDGEHLTRYASDKGMDIANVSDIIPDGVALVGGGNGLAAFDGRRFHRISALDPAALTNITGMVRLNDGTVWLNGQKGAVRIKAGEIERAMANPDYKIAMRLFDADDGLPGAAQSSYPTPSLVKSTDGRLWFAGDGGLAWIDPKEILPSQKPAAVIRSVRVNETSYRPDALPALPPGTRNIQIDYTALGLGDATKSRFRYKLSGMDENWQDAGERRQTSYTNLGPGSYAFRVQVADEENTWIDAAGDMHFVIEPRFYQTTWFLILCITLAAALLWLAYLFRLHQVTQRLLQRVEERHAERDRIARELHDTYLQTVHGLVLKMHAVSHELPEGVAKEKISSTLELARLALTEGRNRVYALRAGPVHNVDLAGAFKAIAQEYDSIAPAHFHVTSTGSIKAVDPLVIDELYASGREAIVNAFKHANANSVRVDLRYGKKGIQVEIADDGKGIDAQVIRDRGVPGHWGLRGIHERMERIQGSCLVTSNADGGTDVTLFVPGRRVYIRR